MLTSIRKGVVFDGNCAHEVEPFEGERYILADLFHCEEVSGSKQHSKTNDDQYASGLAYFCFVEAPKG